MYKKEQQHTWETACREKCSALAELLISKQHDYGKNNILDFGEMGIIVRSNDKFARIKNLNKTGKIPQNESINDTWRDIAGYAILALMVRDSTFDLPYGEAGELARQSDADTIRYADATCAVDEIYEELK